MNRKLIIIICAITTAIAVVICAYYPIRRIVDSARLHRQQERLNALISHTLPPQTERPSPTPLETSEPTFTPVPTPVVYYILPEYQDVYSENNDMIGWLRVPDTVIDYPVVQTPEDENKYLYLDFSGNENLNGTLIMDTDSTVGIGTSEMDYLDGEKPSTNLIIHGHTMKSGEMFGDLPLFEREEYGKEHNIILFDSLYEHREYELISSFYTQVFYPEEQVFKYYTFFQADSQKEFDDWYNNIKEMSLYDTGVEAEFGDEFITLSCCSYQVEDGRFVVVGRRVA